MSIDSISNINNRLNTPNYNPNEPYSTDHQPPYDDPQYLQENCEINNIDGNQELLNHEEKFLHIQKNILKAQELIKHESAAYLIRIARNILDSEMDSCNYDDTMELLFDLDKDIFSLEKEFINHQADNKKYLQNKNEYYIYRINETIRLLYRYETYMNIDDIEQIENDLITIESSNNRIDIPNKSKILEDLKNTREIYTKLYINQKHEMSANEWLLR